jgi:hypothetical protein
MGWTDPTGFSKEATSKQRNRPFNVSTNANSGLVPSVIEMRAVVKLLSKYLGRIRHLPESKPRKL